MSILISTRQAYTEVDTFIELLDDYNKNKIPVKLREFFKKEKDDNYVKEINPEIPIKYQNLKKETLDLIALLNLQYWCEDETQKKELKCIYGQNEIKYQEELIEKYNPDNIFKRKEESISESKETQLQVIKRENFFQKIIDNIKRFIFRNRR